ncbi:MAG: hypothetical protein JXB49_16325 [Bacteroidales bacterium]|nr:hypothetical protein [Bacteroidales bacterium]
MIAPIFSTKQYSWSSVKVFLFGRLVTGLRGVKYSVKKEKEPVHGAGDEPLAIQSGNKTYEGNITLLQSELEAITKAAKTAGYADLTDIPGFDIQVTYANIGDRPTTDSLIGCEFTEETKSLKQGDKFMEISLPVIFLRKVPQV